MLFKKGIFFKWASFLLFLIVFSASFYLAQLVKKRNNEDITRDTHHAAQLIASEAKSKFLLHVSAIIRMGKRWESNKGSAYSIWKKDAEAYIEDMPVFNSIFWIDPEYTLRWVFPKKTNEKLLKISFRANTSQYEWLQMIKNKHQTFIGPLGSLTTNKKDYVIIYPLFYSTAFHGFMGGRFNSELLFISLVNKKFKDRFSVKVMQGDNTIVDIGAMENSNFAAYSQTVSLKTYNYDWSIKVWPNSKSILELRSYMPVVVLFGGAFLSILLAVLSYLIGKHLKTTEQALQAKEEMINTTEKIRLILDKANEGFISIDENGRVVNWNPYASQLFGWSKEEVLNQPLEDFIVPPRYHKRHKMGLDKFLKTGEGPVINQTIEIVGFHKTDGEFPIELTIFTTKIKNTETFHAFIRDISERKAVEKMKNEFISVVSHELRTPLTAIKGSIGLLLGLESEQLPAKHTQLLNIAQKNCDRLIRLINDMLDIEKIEAGKMELKNESISLHSLINEAVSVNQEYAQSYKVELRAQLSEEILVLGDKDRLMQVMTNLISNAVKFSNPEGIVRIKIFKKKDSVQIIVIDEGAGIPLEFHDKIFGKFSQSDSTSARTKGGTGLGLNISKAIVEMHDGTISFLSTQGKGSSFIIELPMLVFDESRLQQTSQQGRLKVLVCEDDQDCAKLLSMMLEQHHFEVDIAYSALQAKAFLEKNQYEVMTLDLMLPDQNGISFIKELQAKNGKPLPVIVVSAIAQKGKKELNGNAFPVVGWIEKPINQSVLNSIIKQALSASPNKKINILHVEDNADLLKITQMLFGSDAFITAARTLAEAKNCLSKESYDLVILDLDLPDGSGADMLPIINWKTKQLIPVVIFSAYELEQQYAQYVDNQLTKSATTNEELVATIKAVINKNMD